MLNGTDTDVFEIRYKLTNFQFNVISDVLSQNFTPLLGPYACSTALHSQNFDAEDLFCASSLSRKV